MALLDPLVSMSHTVSVMLTPCLLPTLSPAHSHQTAPPPVQNTTTLYDREGFAKRKHTEASTTAPNDSTVPSEHILSIEVPKSRNTKHWSLCHPPGNVASSRCNQCLRIQATAFLSGALVKCNSSLLYPTDAWDDEIRHFLRSPSTAAPCESRFHSPEFLKLTYHR